MSSPANHASDPAAAEDSDEIDLLDLLQVVAENLRLLVLAPLAAGLIALGISFLITPTFTATTVFLPPQQQQSAAAVLLQSLGSLGGIAGSAAGLKNPNDQFVSFLKSRSVQNKLIENFKLQDRYESKLLSDARKALDNNVRITSGKDGLISVEVDDHDPILAAQLANSHVSQLDKLMERLAVTEAQQRRVFFEAQLLNVKEKLTNAELALRASGVNSTALKSNPQVAVEAVARIQAEISAHEIKLSAMRSYLADSAPTLRQALTELVALRSQLSKLEKTNDLPSLTGSDYVARFRDFKYYETLFELFAKQFELAKVDEAREGTLVQVVDVAEPPERKSRPKRALIAIITSLTTAMLLVLFLFLKVGMVKLASNQKTTDKIRKIINSFLFKKIP